jgi:hypothetical protein
MFKFFDYIVDLVGAVIGFVVHTISMIVFAFEFIAKGVFYTTALITVLPVFVQVPIFTLVAYTVIITVLHFGD